MADLNVIKNVLSGSAEYTAAYKAETAGDFVNFTFDNDVILDDLLILPVDSGVDISTRVFIQYPSGAQLMVDGGSAINGTTSSTYQLRGCFVNEG